MAGRTWARQPGKLARVSLSDGGVPRVMGALFDEDAM
jgi:hypothetical protein